MKYYIFIFTVCVSSLLVSVKAQETPRKSLRSNEKAEEKGKAVAGLYFGLSFTGLLFDADADNDSVHYIANSKPAIQASIDYFTSNKFSIGLHTSIQTFKVDVLSWDYLDQNGNLKNLKDVQAKMKRFYIGTRLLYHYKNTGKVDLYSGVRAGLLLTNQKFTTNDPNFISDFGTAFPMLNRPSLGIIPIGARIKFNPQFAANFELNLGAPHFISLGASYRF